MKTLNLFFVAILITVFTLSSCQKEGMEDLAKNPEKTSTGITEPNFRAEDINLDLDKLKKQFKAHLENVPSEDIDMDYEEIKALVEAYHYREVDSARYKAIARNSSYNEFNIEVFWWGYRLVLPQWLMKELDKDDNIKNEILDAISSYAALTGPLAPFIEFAVAFLRLTFDIAQVVNQGNGVFLNALWISPNIFVPTPI